MAFATKIIRGSPRLFRQFSTTSSQNTKVAVLGAAGGIGQPLSLLLKTSSIGIKHLALYDVANVVGVTADLSHIDTACKVIKASCWSLGLRATNLSVLLFGKLVNVSALCGYCAIRPPCTSQFCW